MADRCLVAAMTVGRGTVPILPVELRRMVVDFSYPRTIAACAVCGKGVLAVTSDRRLVQLCPYTFRSEECRCMSCLWRSPAPVCESRCALLRKLLGLRR